MAILLLITLATLVRAIIAMALVKSIGDKLEVGTRIHWDAETQNIYYVDVPTSTIYRYKPATKKITKALVGTQPLAFAFPVENQNDTFVAGVGRNIVYLKWDGESDKISNCTTIVEVDTNESLKDNRLNGAKVDPYGRLWAGTMGPTDSNGEVIPGRGSLYSLTNGKLKKHVEGIGISNGIAFDTNLKKMYYIDTLFPGIYQFDYDGENGEIGNKTIIFDFKKNNVKGLPDGLTIDTDGNLWLAVIYGSTVLKISPKDGSILEKIQMPTPQITALTFGSQNLNALYVTTARMLHEGEVPPDPAGNTFKIENLGNVTGLPGDSYKP